MAGGGFIRHLCNSQLEAMQFCRKLLVEQIWSGLMRSSGRMQICAGSISPVKSELQIAKLDSLQGLIKQLKRVQFTMVAPSLQNWSSNMGKSSWHCISGVII